MKKVILILVFIGLIFLITPLPIKKSIKAQGIKIAGLPQDKNCAILKRPDIIIYSEEVIAKRLPSADILNVSASCRIKAKEMVENWKQEDIKNWEKLSNQLCSAKTGWVEINPGTCSAGGPPPICKVDHWIQKPAEAMAQFESENKKIGWERESQLKKMACSCTGEELRKELTASTSNPQSIYGAFFITCPNNPCPPGYNCESGICRTPTSLENSIKKGQTYGEDKVLDKLQDKAEDLLKEMLEKLFPALFKSMTARILVGTVITATIESVKPTEISLHLDAYNRYVQKVNEDLVKLKSLYEEWGRYKATKLGRFPAMIVEDMKKVKTDLSYNGSMMREFYSGVIIERELPPDTCYEVFEYQHQKVMLAFNKLLDSPLPSTEP